MAPLDLAEITNRAVTLISGVAFGPGALIAAMLKPQPEDYAAVFVGQAATQAADAYAQFWENPPNALTSSVNPKIQVVTRLAQDIVASEEFPGGYAKIAHLLVPDQAWCRFKLGGANLIAYDGLVWRGERWAWFPKPWRVFQTPNDN